MEPLSIVMPVKDGAHFLPDSLRVIRENINEGDEIVVVDDNSTDKTWEILLKESKISQNLKILKSPGQGIVDALNFGIENSSFDWIARFDVDDQYPVNRLSEQRKLIGKNVSVIFSDYELRGSDGAQLGIIPSAVTPAATLLSLNSGYRTAHPSALINRTKLLNAGGYLKEDFPAEDLGLWLRISRWGKLISVPDVLLFYNVNPNSISQQKFGTMRTQSKIVLKKYVFSKEQITFILDGIQESLLNYDGQYLCNQRKILLLRDLIKLTRNSPLNPRLVSIICRMLFSFILRPWVFIILIDFRREQTRRKKYRLQLRPKNLKP